MLVAEWDGMMDNTRLRAGVSASLAVLVIMAGNGLAAVEKSPVAL